MRLVYLGGSFVILVLRHERPVARKGSDSCRSGSRGWAVRWVGCGTGHVQVVLSQSNKVQYTSLYIDACISIAK